MYAILCNSEGKSAPGTDSVLKLDGRLGQQRRLLNVREYRSRFCKNFRHKYDEWTHCYFVGRINQMPDSYNQWTPKLHKL